MGTKTYRVSNYSLTMLGGRLGVLIEASSPREAAERYAVECPELNLGGGEVEMGVNVLDGDRVRRFLVIIKAAITAVSSEEVSHEPK